MQATEKLTTQPIPASTATRWADWLVCGFLRHWLALVLTPMLLFVTVPFLAPVAMAAGWTGLGEWIYWLYNPFCHQLPQRSWFLFGPKLTYTLAEINQVYPYSDEWRLRLFLGTPAMGWKVAWSDRMISFYTLTPVFGLVYAVLRRFKPAMPPIALKVLLLALAPLALDGLTHIANDMLFGVSGGGFRDTNAWLAVLTGNAFPSFYAGDHLGTFNWWLRLISGALAAWGLAFYVFPWTNAIFAEEREHYTGCKNT